jgi:hypothetical protein
MARPSYAEKLGGGQAYDHSSDIFVIIIQARKYTA